MPPESILRPLEDNLALLQITGLNDIQDFDGGLEENRDDYWDDEESGIYWHLEDGKNELDRGLQDDDGEDEIDGTATWSPLLLHAVNSDDEANDFFTNRPQVPPNMIPIDPLDFPDDPFFSPTSVNDSGIDITLGTPAPKATRSRGNDRLSRHERIQSAIDILRAGRVSPMDFLNAIADAESDRYKMHKKYLYSKNGKAKLRELLDNIMEDKRGKGIILEWMEPHALQQVSQRISQGMKPLGKVINTTTTQLTPKDLRDWTLADSGKIVTEENPELMHVIRTASRSVRSEKNTKKNTYNVSILDDSTFKYSSINVLRVKLSSHFSFASFVQIGTWHFRQSWDSSWPLMAQHAKSWTRHIHVDSISNIQGSLPLKNTSPTCV